MDAVAHRQEVKRRAVLAAAAELYADGGYRATSMNDLAARVGLSKPALYHYVSSKEVVLVELYKDVLESSTDAVAELERTSTSAIDALRAVIVQRVAYTCENRALLRVFFEEEAGLPRDHLAVVLKARGEYDEAVMAITLRAIEEGSLAIDVAPRIFVNSMLGAANWVYKWFDPDGRLGPTELGEEIAGVFLGQVVTRAVRE